MLDIIWFPIVAAVVLAVDLTLYIAKQRRGAKRARSMAAHPAGKGLDTRRVMR